MISQRNRYTSSSTTSSLREYAYKYNIGENVIARLEAAERERDQLRAQLFDALVAERRRTLAEALRVTDMGQSGFRCVLREPKESET